MFSMIEKRHSSFDRSGYQHTIAVSNETAVTPIRLRPQTTCHYLNHTPVPAVPDRPLLSGGRNLLFEAEIRE